MSVIFCANECATGTSAKELKPQAFIAPGGWGGVWCNESNALASQAPPEQIRRQRQGQAGCRGVVAVPLVAHEGVRRVEFVPGEADARPAQLGVDALAAFRGHVRILPAE